MNIVKKVNIPDCEIALEGRLDTSTSPELENELNQLQEGVTDLTFDFSKLDYISSAGLRILLTTQKKMMKIGSMKLKGVNPDVMDVFEITGFADILTIV
ncbi:MAG: STAS domain-containing protein [Parasporobacterium sp.]|nr:STAS domain-containing protein [Parasporobacterium sp.]